MERSFSTLTRLELCQKKFTQKPHLIAELASFALSSGNIKLGRGKLSLQLSSENEEVILRISSIIAKLYGVRSEILAYEKTQPKKHTVYSIEVSPTDEAGKLLFDIGLLTGTSEDYSFSSVNKALFEPEGCFEAALRGAFLGCGVLCDPIKAYRLEFVFNEEEFAKLLQEKMLEAGIQAHMLERKERYVVYVKQIESISDVLILSGASGVMMQIESVRVEKDVINNLNRSGNCIVSNINKAVVASQKQIEDINKLMLNKVKLSSSLKEACELRINNPDLSLNELSGISGISKTALNKRFIKIRELAQELE